MRNGLIASPLILAMSDLCELMYVPIPCVRATVCKFPDPLQRLPVMPPKFPVPLRREFARKPLNLLAHYARESFGEALNRLYSMLISLLAGNLGWRRVRSGLPPQPFNNAASF